MMDSGEIQHKVICYGEILWDLLPSGPQPGGAPMNVAYHLQKMGYRPALITRIGLDEYGKKLVNMLSGNNVCTEYFQIDYDHLTGIVHARPNEDEEVSYEIVQPAAWDFISWENNFEYLMQQAEYFIFGSLITRSVASRNTLFKLLEMAKKKILDINLRPPFFNKRIIEQLLGKTDILKLNLAELHMITGWFANYKSDIERIAMLQERFSIDTIIVTKGSKGALVHTGDHYLQHEGYEVNVADTVGSGDAFLAAIVHCLFQGPLTKDSLRFANAVGACVAAAPGGCPDYDLKQVHHLINTGKEKELKP